MAMAMAACNTSQRLSVVNPDGVKYFMEKLMFQIYEHFDDQELVDVTFKLSNPSALVTAHRLILSAASPYFRELFKSDKGTCPLIEISDIDSDTFEHLITFCYTGKALITIDNVDQILKAALILQLDDAVANCADFLIEHINDYTLQRAYALDNDTQSVVLKQKMLEYEINNFMNVIQSAEFLNFDANKLQHILESDDLNVPTEEDVFEAVKRWYEHDASARKQQLPDIIACLRLTQFDVNFLLTHIQSLPGCECLSFKALSWVSCPSARSRLTLKYTERRGRQRVLSEESFLALNIGGGGQPRPIFQYNKIEDSWQKWIDIQIDVNDFEVVFIDDNLIFIGGTRNNNAINEVSCWNFKTKTFKQMPSMSEPRYWHCLVLLNDKIYAIGGKGTENKFLKSVEMYSVSNGWKSINSMITPRRSACAVAFNGKIYVMGGYNESYLKSVECYDPTTNCWTQCADMNEAHSDTPGAAVHNGQIFVLGGWNGHERSPTVERYDPQRNKWTKICSLSTGHSGLGCISIDNQLWAVGGYDNNYVSVYDEQNDKWIDKKSIPFAGPYHCFTVPKTLLKSE